METVQRKPKKTEHHDEPHKTKHFDNTEAETQYSLLLLQ